MRFTRIILFAGLLLLFPPAAHSEVFTLWPHRGNGSAAGKFEMLSGISGAELFSREMEVNGVRLTLCAYPITVSMTDFIAFLKRNFASGQLQLGRDFVRVSGKLPDGSIDRWLLVMPEPGKDPTLFRCIAPEQLPKATQWPSELPPLPPDAKIDQVVRIPASGSVYGSFQTIDKHPEFMLSSMVSQLKSAGWTPLSNEKDNPDGGRGELFIRENPRTILWVNYSDNGFGACYVRPLGK